MRAETRANHAALHKLRGALEYDLKFTLYSMVMQHFSPQGREEADAPLRVPHPTRDEYVPVELDERELARLDACARVFDAWLTAPAEATLMRARLKYGMLGKETQRALAEWWGNSHVGDDAGNAVDVKKEVETAICMEFGRLLNECMEFDQEEGRAMKEMRGR